MPYELFESFQTGLYSTVSIMIDYVTFNIALMSHFGELDSNIITSISVTKHRYLARWNIISFYLRNFESNSNIITTFLVARWNGVITTKRTVTFSGYFVKKCCNSLPLCILKMYHNFLCSNKYEYCINNSDVLSFILNSL